MIKIFFEDHHVASLLVITGFIAILGVPLFLAFIGLLSYN